MHCMVLDTVSHVILNDHGMNLTLIPGSLAKELTLQLGLRLSTMLCVLL